MYSPSFWGDSKRRQADTWSLQGSGKEQIIRYHFRQGQGRKVSKVLGQGVATSDGWSGRASEKVAFELSLEQGGSLVSWMTL
jgi:hypothetical protein